jgi:hypothetical protein
MSKGARSILSSTNKNDRWRAEGLSKIAQTEEIRIDFANQILTSETRRTTMTIFLASGGAMEARPAEGDL